MLSKTFCGSTSLKRGVVASFHEMLREKSQGWPSQYEKMFASPSCIDGSGVCAPTCAMRWSIEMPFRTEP
jgi:hypothetical protein